MATQQMLIVCDDRHVLVPQHAWPWAPLPGRRNALPSSTCEAADRLLLLADRVWARMEVCCGDRSAMWLRCPRVSRTAGTLS
jgi:hypothetical protein